VATHCVLRSLETAAKAPLKNPLGKRQGFRDTYAHRFNEISVALAEYAASAVLAFATAGWLRLGVWKIPAKTADRNLNKIGGASRRA